MPFVRRTAPGTLARPARRHGATIASLLVMLATILLPGVATAAPAPPKPPTTSGNARATGRLASQPVVVDLRTLPPPTGAATEHSPKPEHPRDPAALAQDKRSPNYEQIRARQISQAGVLPAPAINASSAQISSSSPLIGTSYDAEASIGVAYEPPDTQSAASSSYVVEFTNDAGAVYDRSTLSRTQFFALTNLCPVPAGWEESDAKVLYDPPSDRFVASCLVFNRSTNNATVYALVSRTNVPDVWNRYTVPAPVTTTLYDQPKIGVSQDKVTVAWNAYANGTTFTGSEIWVGDYSLMQQGMTTYWQSFAPDTTKFSPVPVQQIDSQTRQWVVYNKGTAAGIMSIDGNPTNNNVSSQWNEAAVATTYSPPDAPQLGSTALIGTGDDRAESGVFRSGKVWMSGNDSCAVGPPPVVACLRLTQWNVTVSPPSLVQSFVVAGANNTSFLYYPAISMDGNGDAIFVFSRSSTSEYPYVQVADQLAGAPNGAVSGSALVKAGEQPYVTQYMRWGDYSSAGPDPASTANAVWVAGEYSAAGSSGNWGTAMGRVNP